MLRRRQDCLCWKERAARVCRFLIPHRSTLACALSRSPHGLRADEKDGSGLGREHGVAEGAKQDVAKPAKRGAGTMPQAVKQAGAITCHEDAQRCRQGGGGRGSRRSRLNWRRMTSSGAQLRGADLESALQVDPSTATARWPSSTPATLSRCGSEAARSSAGRTSQRRRLSTSRRSRGCPRATADCLRVIAVSHPWQQPDHPDPKEVNLTLLAKVLERFIAEKAMRARGGRHTYACFFDFMSCFQKGPDGKRTDNSRWRYSARPSRI